MSPRKIHIRRLSHMRYGHADMQRIDTFLKDFGMTEVKRTSNPERIYYRGYGPDQYVYVAEKSVTPIFLGGCFLVESMLDLKYAATLPCARNSITELTDAPGRGHAVTLVDPDGIPVNLIYGQEERERDEAPIKVSYNTEQEKERVGDFLRFTEAPAKVHKLRHFGLCVSNFKKTYDFYTTLFNFTPSDVLYVDELNGKKDVAAFLHLDRGDEYVDHHCFFFSQIPDPAHVHHCSFEVHDMDTQFLGHQWLEKRHYQMSG